MSQDLLTNVGAVAHIPLVFTDARGGVTSPPAGGACVSSDETIATVVLADSDSFVTVTAVAVGSATMSYTNGALGASLVVSVAAAVPVSVDFDTPAATIQ